LINWSFAWRILGAHEARADDVLSRKLPLDRWRRSIYEHVRFIAGFYSAYSSANNHRIGEAAGVYVATLTWPYWKRFGAWHDTARNILEAEAVHQVSPDGVTREQSTSYQQFVFDLLAIPALAAHAAREPMPQPYIDRLAKMSGFVAALLDADGNFPQIGDADDALVVSFGRDDARTAPAATAGLGAILDGRAPALPGAVPYPDRLRWLLASAPSIPASDVSTRRAEMQGSLISFPEGGYHVVRTKPAQGPAARAVMDTGPLGYLSIAAHGHADALSILLWIDEHEFLVDTGTFAYHCDEAWRLYFRGTRAHNTVALDGADQSVSGGNFMWLSHADARCIRALALDDIVVVEGEHDGYSRPGARAIHRRTLTLSSREPAGTVRDYVEFTGRPRAVAVFWHFAEQCVVESSGGSLVARRDGCWLRLSSEGPEVSAKVLHGSEQPLGGWVSRRFGHKTPSTTVVWEFTADASAELVTHIAYGRLGA
jgi:hypothetical protein